MTKKIKLVKNNTPKVVKTKDTFRVIHRDIPLREFLALPPSPFQRPIEARLKAAAVLEALTQFRVEHLDVAIAILTKDVFDPETNTLYKKGTMFVQNGNTRARVWYNHLMGIEPMSDFVPDMVRATIYEFDSLEAIKSNYYTFDSMTSAERTKEKLAGLMSTYYSYEAKNNLVKSGQFLGALSWASHCYDKKLYPTWKKSNIDYAAAMLPIYIEEIKHWDKLCTHAKHNKNWDCATFSAAIMALKKHGLKNKKVNDFIKRIDTDKVEGVTDGPTHVLREWDSRRIFPKHSNSWDCQFRIDSKNKEIGLRATVSYVLYYLDKYMNDEIVSKCGPGWDKTAENYFEDPNNSGPGISSSLYDHLMDTNPGLNVVNS